MTIKVLGSGCPNCQRLENNVNQAVTENKIEAKVEKITDLIKIVQFGAMGMPALVVNEKLVIAGRVPEVTEIKEILKNA
ncbi:MAG: TM0996/MTH895 family glutaredoxin-like protein [Candidatus Buchananbacteria bacterium]|nr:TM0996/MTH895 family glutaredoxin-like protein [Candidatus Buchananbacteria bacterium]